MNLALAILLFNSGYHSGHEDTVEGMYTDVHPDDIDSYHSDLVEEIILEYKKEDDNDHGRDCDCWSCNPN